jgi:hypothetical protein
MLYKILASIQDLDRRRDSSVNTVTRLGARQLGFNTRQGQWRDLSSPPHPHRHIGTHKVVPKGFRGALKPGVNGRGVKLITYLHLVPRSRICGAIPSFFHASSWCNA